MGKKASQDYKYTIKERKFCHNITHGMSKAEAYRDAGYKAHNAKKDGIAASKIQMKPKIKILIDEMFEDQNKAARMTKEKLVDWLTDLITTDQEDMEKVQEKQFSVKGQPNKVKRAIAGITEHPGKYGSTIKVTRWDAIRAAQLLAQIQGWNNSEDKDDEPIKLTIQIGEAE